MNDGSSEIAELGVNDGSSVNVELGVNDGSSANVELGVNESKGCIWISVLPLRTIEEPGMKGLRGGT